jgi:hypothetical protein
MADSRRSLASVLCVVGLLALAAWAYRGDVWRLVGGNAVSASPSIDFNPYPTQYLPAVLVLPTPSPVPPPLATLHVGLRLRWDGSGYIFFDGYVWRPGTHLTREIDQQIDSDTVGVSARQWYAPNPLGYDEVSWVCHYNTISNHAEYCSSESDPAWKWGFWWILPADIVPAGGQRVTIDGQVFDVSGPHTMQTGYGEATYWRLRNRNRFLFHSNGGEWTQYVEASDANLYYEISSGMLLYNNIKRTLYKNGESTSNYVQYEELISERSGRNALTAEGETENTSDVQLVPLLSAAGIEVSSLAVR